MANDGNYKKKKIGEHTLKPETMMMSYGYNPQFSEGSVKPPVFLTSTFAYQTPEEGEEFFHIMAGRKPAPAGSVGGLIYSRFNHPNVEIIEDRLSLFEGSESAVVCSSGMGAISAILLAYLRPGDVIVQSAPLYGGTETLIRKFLPEFNIHTGEFHNGLDEMGMLSSLRAAAQKGRLAMVFVESPANPTNTLVDFAALNRVLDIIKTETGHRPISVCDNTLMGPVFQQAVPQGIDMAMYSLTKYVGGHSDLVAGAVCGSRDILRPVRAIRGAIGLNLDPHTSWMISRSLETLSIRMERAAASGRKVAEWLANNPYKPAKVLHPDLITDAAYQAVYQRQCSGPSSTFSFVMDIAKADAFRLINNLSIFKSAVSLGGSESLVCHPGSTTHSGVPAELRDRFGISNGLIRLSIGLEHPDDLIADLDHAFAATFGTN
ncbi:cystathionine gamma-synthase family protein [Alishewanella sp. 16-MA]|uniref:Cystathionine gamma-synthase family protein n=1 Tax=Alishewanella maricola TaxID=2795740 RepID=A0ABS8C258_9ALTE|nr:cystathionine gamma-synthase family protein [Alishewanella maricola]MCB5226389.1 cystathionine gamma-synthase family protein [Alishewanella maricola]